jgi:hypothetical protein
MTVFLSSPSSEAEDLVNAALKFFLATDSNTAGFNLEKSRPQPVPIQFRALIVNSLPKEDRLTKLNELRKSKLGSLQAVLQMHQRQSVYEVVVFESRPKPFAFIGLHQRAVLLISDAALDSLSAEQLQASVAHEIGHEYVWNEYIDAANHNDDRRQKEFELICDGIAILTLRRAGLDPMALLTAAQKIANINLSGTGPAANGHRYPSPNDRKRFAQAILIWANSQGRSKDLTSEPSKER